MGLFANVCKHIQVVESQMLDLPKPNPILAIHRGKQQPYVACYNVSLNITLQSPYRAAMSGEVKCYNDPYDLFLPYSKTKPCRTKTNVHQPSIYMFIAERWPVL